MSNEEFVPHHITATAADLVGNNGRGRIVLLPGSDGRSAEIASNFDGLEERPSPRSHNVYLGTLQHEGRTIDVASVCSGMGTPSLDIIVQELFHLGTRVFLRVGTAGSLQAPRVKVGDLVVGTGAVRDEGTSGNYVPPEYPSIASPVLVQAALEAARRIGFGDRTSSGLVHSKDSLFAREFGAGPMAEESKRYMAVLKRAGVVASEMESSHLFVLAALFTQDLAVAGGEGLLEVLAGSVLGIIGDEGPFAPAEQAKATVADSVQLAIETVKELAVSQWWNSTA
jgi:uridine phosphorylase